MPLPKSTRSPYVEALIIQNELDYDINKQLKIDDRNISTLNSDQQTIFDAVMTAVNSTDQYPKVFFVDGPGGTGKHSCITLYWLRFVHNLKLLLP